MDNFSANGVVGNLTDATNPGLTAGDVDFITPILAGGTDFFSLEGPPTALTPVTTPEPASLAVLGSSLVSFAFAAGRRRRKTL